MSRLRNLFRAVASGYGVLAANALFSLGSVPLALGYLTTEEFGLWALIVQLAGYLALLDLGISASVGRVLVDYKDHRDGGDYGSIILTGSLVLGVQGGVILIAGIHLAPTLAGLLNIPEHLREAFTSLMVWQCAITACGLASRVFYHVLAAHQRNDIVNYGQMIVFGVNFLMMWGCFRTGFKLYSLPLASAGSWLMSTMLVAWACSRLGLYPVRGAWGRPNWARFKELFNFGWEVFLIAIGAQIIVVGQSFIITRTMGLASAAIWSVCTKSLTLVCQLVWRIDDFSAYVFCEMLARGERERLYQRFQDVVVLTAALSGASAVVFAVCNGPFVAVWTHGKMNWSGWNNVLLGCWLMLLSVVRCHTGFVFVTKQIRFTRYIYFVEGCVFFLLASWAVRFGGFLGIIMTSIVCSLIFSGAYGVWRTMEYFQVGWREVLVRWFVPEAKILGLLIPWTALVQVGVGNLPEQFRLLTNAVLVGVPAAILFLRWGLPRNLQSVMVQRAPWKVHLVLKRVFPAAQP